MTPPADALAHWTWPGGVQACLLALPAGLSRDAARMDWQRRLAAGPWQAAERQGRRVGWTLAGRWAVRVSYGHWPQDQAAPAGPSAVVVVAWRPLGGDDWAIDCVADLALPEAAALLRLYGVPPAQDFPRAWSTLEARAKLQGGLVEGATLPVQHPVFTHRAAGWVACMAAAPAAAALSRPVAAPASRSSHP